MTSERDCLLYVDVNNREQILEDLRQYMDAEPEEATLTVPGLEVRVDRNERGREFSPESVFPDWPTVVEISRAGSAEERATDARTSADADVDMAQVVASLIRRLRRRGHRVVAVCSYQDALPRDDTLSPHRIERDDLDGGSAGGRHTYRDGPFTGTVVDRWEDGTLRSETEMLAGVLDGRVRAYREDGRLWREGWYDAGQQVRERRWHPDGQLAFDARILGDGPLMHNQEWTPEGQPIGPGKPGP